jgi:hypothetical protein
VLLPTGKVEISRDVRFDESAAPASDARFGMLSDLMETVTQHQTQHQTQQQPQPQLQQPPQQYAQQQQQLQSSQPLQPEQMQQLMSSNPLFDEQEEEAPAVSLPASAAQPSLEVATPRRNPSRNRQPPQDPYQKYLHGLPHNAHVNFHL